MARILQYCWAFATLTLPLAAARADSPVTLEYLQARVLAEQASDHQSGVCGSDSNVACTNAGLQSLPSRYGTLGHLFVPLDALAPEFSSPDSPASLRQVAKELHSLVVPDDALIEEAGEGESDAGAHVDFQQLVGQNPVFGARLRWGVHAQNRVLEIASSLVPPSLLPLHCSQELPNSEAVDIAVLALLEAGISEIDHEGAIAEFGVLPPHLALHGRDETNAFGACGWRISLSDGNDTWLVFVDQATYFAEFLRVTMADEPNQIFHANFNMVDGDDVLLCSGSTCATYPFPPGTTQAANLRAAEFSVFLDDWFSRYGWDNGDQTGFMTVRADNINTTSDGAVFDWATKAVKLGPASVCRDVVGHEFTHGMVTNELDFYALNTGWVADGMGDGMGELFELDVAGTADWLHGTGGTCAFPKRSLSDPPSMSAASVGGLPFPDNRWMFESTYSNVSHFNGTILGKLTWLLGRGTTSTAPTTHWGVSSQPVGKDWAIWTLMSGIVGMTDDDDFDLIAARMVASSPVGTIRTNVQNALWATGAWSLEGMSGVAADSAVSVATFARNRLTARYMFSNITTSSNIVYRYKYCALNSLCSWSSPTVVGPTPTPTDAPAVMEFSGKLHIVYMSMVFGWPVLMYQNLDSTGALGGLSLLAAAQGQASLAVFNGKLYVFYRLAGAGSTDVAFRSLDTAGNWSAEVALVTASYSPSVAATVDGNLWLLIGLSGRLKYMRMNSSGSWTPATDVPNIPPLAGSEHAYFLIDGSPSAEQQNGRLYVGWHGLGREYMISYGPTGQSQSGWTRAQEGYFDTSSGPQRFDVSLTTKGGDGRLYRMLRTPTNSIMYRNHAGY